MQKIKITHIILLGLFLCFSFSVKAEYAHYSGNSWLAMCGEYSSKKTFINAACESYTRGVIEGFYWGYMASQTIESGKEKQNKPYCFESSHTIEQYILVIKKAALEVPQFLHKPAPWLIDGAMRAAFKCDNN